MRRRVRPLLPLLLLLAPGVALAQALPWCEPQAPGPASVRAPGVEVVLHAHCYAEEGRLVRVQWTGEGVPDGAAESFEGKNEVDARLTLAWPRNGTYAVEATPFDGLGREGSRATFYLNVYPREVFDAGPAVEGAPACTPLAPDETSVAVWQLIDFEVACSGMDLDAVVWFRDGVYFDTTRGLSSPHGNAFQTLELREGGTHTVSAVGLDAEGRAGRAVTWTFVVGEGGGGAPRSSVPQWVRDAVEWMGLPITILTLLTGLIGVPVAVVQAVRHWEDLRGMVRSAFRSKK